MKELNIPILSQSPICIVFGDGTIDELGRWARDQGASRALLVTDHGILAAGHADRATRSLAAVGVRVEVFADVEENPTTRHVAAGLQAAARFQPDWIVAVGGGSAMDCAKGVNLLYTNGGEMRDYWGINKATRPLLPSILVPTTAGTGSEAQSFALISDAVTHQKMACGDRRLPTEGGLRPSIAILDPDLTRTAPRAVAAAVGMDAIAHAVETAGSRARTATSREFSRLAFQHSTLAFPFAMRNAKDDGARRGMLIGAHLAGCAIEHSMLGAAHACANPLTAAYGIAHGIAVGLLLPHVVRFNTAANDNPYSDLDEEVSLNLGPATSPENAGAGLARLIESLLREAQLPRLLRECGVEAARLPELAGLAAQQWTATFNPRPVGATELLAIYRAAY